MEPYAKYNIEKQTYEHTHLFSLLGFLLLGWYIHLSQKRITGHSKEKGNNTRESQ